jgi:hypothetical protein
LVLWRNNAANKVWKDECALGLIYYANNTVNNLKKKRTKCVRDKKKNQMRKDKKKVLGMYKPSSEDIPAS